MPFMASMARTPIFIGEAQSAAPVSMEEDAYSAPVHIHAAAVQLNDGLDIMAQLTLRSAWYSRWLPPF